MRDGAILRADVYRPPGDGPWPVLLVRTPYGKQDPGVLARLNPVGAAGRGYLVVIQDCRGRFRSDGDWAPLVHESADGYDTVAWAARLPGSDGRVAMYGPSYLGHTQWAAIAARPPGLCAAMPEFTWSNPHDGLITRGGAYELGLMTQWTLSLGINVLERRFADRPEERQRQLAELNSAIGELTTRTCWETSPGESIRRLGLPAPSSDVESTGVSPSPHIPMLIVAGWYDCFLQGSLDSYVSARNVGAPASLIVGPWSHDGPSPLADELEWLDRQLASPTHEPNVRIFVTGSNEWRNLPTWPPEATDAAWYLDADGRLSPAPPDAASPQDTFVHDPNAPVPACGGALLLSPEFPAGPLDQREIEKRDDVLTYTSAALREPLEVVGRIRLHLFADSTASTTDWVARLCDVDTDGVSRNLTDGIVRAHQPHTNEHSIDLWSTAHVFLPGHRIRMQITGSCFPRWDRADGARQTVQHDAARPSRLILPVRHV
ncbi:CocE/NonD family hydrolase [Actinospica sp.]|uniref:CocE/NonD family hydrolase n=1 Tax=Actinospica sp. TaxID=1872142 RepID=UPI002C64462E|nr:CocE/NonD family hydrolase [Actinospica sp.]HWG23262.1 CocE/NonD family hydrolase [Actinospica sp.]